MSAGIEPEIIAEAALTTAVAELVKSAGEDSAVALLERHPRPHPGGRVSPPRTPRPLKHQGVGQ